MTAAHAVHPAALVVTSEFRAGATARAPADQARKGVGSGDSPTQPGISGG